MIEQIGSSMEPSAILWATLGISIAAFGLLWLVQVKTRDVGVVDYYWGPGFAVIAWLALLWTPMASAAASGLQFVFATLITIWSLRLAGQLILRHRGSTTEDARYAAMREAGGRNFWWTSLFKIFVLQAIIMWLVASPIHTALLYPVEAPIEGLFWLGTAVFLVGFLIEAIADYQLYRGKHEVSAKQTFNGGLWGLSRHPNYFGELMLWFGICLMAFAISGSLWSFFGLGILAVAILGISLPLTEQHMLESRSDYREYMARVPKIIPNVFGNASGTGQQDPAE